MKDREFTYRDDTYRRVSKSAARKAYDAGRVLAFVPGKLSPWYLDGVFVCAPIRKPDADADIDGTDFDTRVRGYEFYNCNSSETGYYTQFYVAKDRNND